MISHAPVQIIEVTEGKAPHVYAIGEVKKKFCEFVYEIASSTGKYDIRKCEPCKNKCLTMESILKHKDFT